LSVEEKVATLKIGTDALGVCFENEIFRREGVQIFACVFIIDHPDTITLG